ncbi:MAG: hypothetical protein KBT04_04415 [Bacteroidales bacterium]|nr:hypothetical protein [Candidatus Colimorpha onthohippi]
MRRRRAVVGVSVVLVGVCALCFMGFSNCVDFGSWLKGIGNKGQRPERRTVYKRLLRSQIPTLDWSTVNYQQLFSDLNDVQLCAATRLGVDQADGAIAPDTCKRLCRISTTPLYVVDYMSYSKPYLVPEAVLMLHYIGDRFAEILQQRQSDGHTYRPIVTSAFRSNSDVTDLRRCNSNASENSCHAYGTTIDITYARFLRDDGMEVNDIWLKEVLAQTLYELRYEQICYVIYEVRQPCFHITVRNTAYTGNGKYTLCTYDALPELPSVRLHCNENQEADLPIIADANSSNQDVQSNTPQLSDHKTVSPANTYRTATSVVQSRNRHHKSNAVNAANYIEY